MALAPHPVARASFAVAVLAVMRANFAVVVSANPILAVILLWLPAVWDAVVLLHNAVEPVALKDQAAVLGIWFVLIKIQVCVEPLEFIEFIASTYKMQYCESSETIDFLSRIQETECFTWT
jgi:hypothetical protein